MKLLSILFLVVQLGVRGGKSWLICEWLLVKCIQYPGSKWFIGREELKRLMGSTYITFLKVCAWHKIPNESWKLNGSYNYIEFVNGSRIDLLDLKFLPSDPLYERFGSLEFTGGAIEEAGEVDFLAFDVLKSRIGRHLNREFGIKSKLLITCNPKKNWLYQIVYKPWKEKRLPVEYSFIQSLYGDNKHTADEYGSNLAQIVDKGNRERLMNGNWEYDDDPNTLIEYDALIDLFTNNVPENGVRFITADIARYGQDKTIIYVWEGFKLYKFFAYGKQGIDQTIIKLRQIAEEERVPYSRILVDEDGVGGGVVDGLRGIKGFVNGSVALDNPITHKKENYRNLKTQCYYLLAELINNRGMVVSAYDLEMRTKLIEELEQVKSKDLDKEGKLYIVPKEDVKEALGRSPDYSDALMMRMWFELVPVSKTFEQRLPSGLVRQLRPDLNTIQY
jgi:phage terminase large subunit